MAEQLPTGTVTFLFSDIEGSTRLLERLGPEYEQVLSEHRSLVRMRLTAMEGSRSTPGRRFFVAFPRRGAVAAAEEIQRATASSGPGADRAAHGGGFSLGGDGYVGMDVHRAPHLRGCARTPGPSAVDARPRGCADPYIGEHRLRTHGAPAPPPARRCRPPGRVPSADAPLDAVVTNLPVQPTPLRRTGAGAADARALLERGDSGS